MEAVEALRDAGKNVAYATNDPRSATEDYVARLWKIGIRASMSDVVTVGGALQHLLAETRSGRTAFVIGTEALRRHVAEAGLKILNGTDLASRAEVVVVGGHRGAGLRRPARRPRWPCGAAPTSSPPPATRPTRSPTASGPAPARSWPRSRWRAAQTAEIVGKPQPQLLFTALDRLGEGRTLVVGDRVDTDLAAAAAASAGRGAGPERRHEAARH